MKNLYVHSIFGVLFLFLSTLYSCQNTDLLKKLVKDTKNSMQADYILEKEKICDLNNDQKEDIILIYKPKNVDREIESLDTPVIVLLSQNNNYTKIKNGNILYSYIPGDSVLDNNLVIKNEFFTLEQAEGNGNNKKKAYITFKFYKSSRHIFLSKYGIETSVPGKKGMVTKTQIFSAKDFGQIRFENFDSESILPVIKTQ